MPQTHVLGQLWYGIGDQMFFVLRTVSLENRILQVSRHVAEPFLSNCGEEQWSSSTTDHRTFGSDLAPNARLRRTNDHSSCFGLTSVLESQDPTNVQDVFPNVVCTQACLDRMKCQPRSIGLYRCVHSSVPSLSSFFMLTSPVLCITALTLCCTSPNYVFLQFLMWCQSVSVLT